VGEPTLARIAADRGLSLADNAGDPALIAAVAWNLSCVLTSAGEVNDSVELARATSTRLAWSIRVWLGGLAWAALPAKWCRCIWRCCILFLLLLFLLCFVSLSASISF